MNQLVFRWDQVTVCANLLPSPPSMPRFLQSLFTKRQDEPAPIPVATHGPPHSLRLETGTYPVMRGVRYTVFRGIVTRVQQGSPIRTCQRKPAPEEWDGFWKTVKILGVRRWRADYQKPRKDGFHTLDGSAWRFSLRAESFAVHSGGRCAYPSITYPHQSTCSSEALQILQTELDCLLAGRQVH
jgi:hypothetical protein